MKRKTERIIWISITSFLSLIIIGIGILVLIAYNQVQKKKNSKEASYLPLLQESQGYNDKLDLNLPSFTYQPSNDSNLVHVRTYFNLDSVVGNGNELSQIKNLMYYMHDLVRHDGNNPLKDVSRNSISLIDYCKKENVGMNCRMMAISLNEFYLAMGFPSRFVVCLPQDSTDIDSHIINIVYSRDLSKWIWIDPTFAAYVADEKNQLLNIEEVRYRLINNLPLVLNEDANWNHEKQTAKYYLKTYMAKNLYWVECLADSRYAAEDATLEDRQYIRLCPEGFSGFHYKNYITNNPHYFWQIPDRLNQ
ncbi:MAG: transglutaminase domain-containing protein [Dysgonamonadaceae bacterium]|jgi:hypothetical protein|nr:transglutaminase domain-containing protein [Dysgonamonadaceae bacterium]